MKLTSSLPCPEFVRVDVLGNGPDFQGAESSIWQNILPSGYLLHSHGKSAFLIGKPSINGHSHGYVKQP